MTPTSAVAIAAPQPAARQTPHDGATQDDMFSRMLNDSSRRMAADETAVTLPNKLAGSRNKPADATRSDTDRPLADTASGQPAPVLDLPAQALSWAEHVKARRGLQDGVLSEGAQAARLASGIVAGGVQPRAMEGRIDMLSGADAGERGADARMVRATAFANGASSNEAGHLPATGSDRIETDTHGLSDPTNSLRPVPAGAAVDRSRGAMERRLDPNNWTSAAQDSRFSGTQRSVPGDATALTPNLLEMSDVPLNRSSLGETVAAEPSIEPHAPAFAQILRESVTDVVPRSINVPVGQAQWGQAVGQQVVAWSQQAKQGDIKAELRLDPPELGPLRVALHIVDGVTTASFASAHAAVRAALEQAMPQLQQAFAQAGLSLGEASVNHSDGSDAQQQQADQSGGQGLYQGQATPDAPAPVSVQPLRASAGLVDIFA